MKAQQFVQKAAMAMAMAFASAMYSGPARAEVTLAEVDGWEAFTDGRVAGFFSYVNGDAYPAPIPDAYGRDKTALGGGSTANSDKAATDPDGKVENMRVRSGFVGNVFGFGVRRALDESTTLKAYTHFSYVIESERRRKYSPVYPDFREAYLKLDGPWGSFWLGRSLSLFSRGATEITYLYGFKYGVGYPGPIDSSGTAAGHIGFGVMANGFSAGAVYTTPSLAGLQLSVGLFDPATFAGSYWARTKFLRPEAELSYEAKLGNVGLVRLFGNGLWQGLYQANGGQSTSLYGAGGGARVEVGPVRLGLAGHYGRGIGFTYALEASEVTFSTPEQNYELRTFDGYYAQLMLALGKVDVSAGFGVSRVHLLDSDAFDRNNDDGDPATPTANDFDNDANPATPSNNDLDLDPNTLDPNDPTTESLIKQQMGISAGVVYHVADNLHLDLDVFRADFSWYLGHKQVLNIVNAGATVDW